MHFPGWVSELEWEIYPGFCRKSARASNHALRLWKAGDLHILAALSGPA